MKLVNNLPNDIEIEVSDEETILVPGATEAHNEEGLLVATPGSVDLTPEQASFMQAGVFADEGLPVLFADGALILEADDEGA
jgi:hypothetical protein